MQSLQSQRTNIDTAGRVHSVSERTSLNCARVVYELSKWSAGQILLMRCGALPELISLLELETLYSTGRITHCCDSQTQCHANGLLYHSVSTLHFILMYAPGAKTVRFRVIFTENNRHL